MSDGFKELCRRAYPPDGGDPTIEDQDNLWIATLNLPQWSFLVHELDFDEPRPYMAELEGEVCVFAFTDSDFMSQFARANNLVGEDGEVYTLEMKTRSALKWLKEAANNGVTTVHFNYGCPGWYAPIESLDAVCQHLKGRLK